MARKIWPSTLGHKFEKDLEYLEVFLLESQSKCQHQKTQLKFSIEKLK